MSLRLYFHPLSSFCQKALVALYENDTPFERRIVDLGDATSRAAFLAVWPIGKFPVLHDEGRDRTIPESSIIIEYLHAHYPGRTKLLPDDADGALQARLWDRFYDLYVNVPMQAIVADRRRPADRKDPLGVEQARARLQTAYGVIEREMASKPWAAGGRVQHGRLRRRASVVLRRQGDAVRRCACQRGPLLRTLARAPVLCPCAGGSGALPPPVPRED